MKRKLSMTLAIILVATSLASCQSIQTQEELTNSSEFTPSVTTSNDITDIEENDIKDVPAFDVEFEENVGSNETDGLKYTDLPLHEEMNDFMYDDMQELTVMPQEFLDYCESVGLQIKADEEEYPIGVFTTNYVIAKDDVEFTIAAILDLTNDNTDIFYHNSNNAKSLKATRSVETGEFTEGYMLLGKTISITRDLEGNIQNIDLSNQELNQLYVDKTLEFHELYKEHQVE